MSDYKQHSFDAYCKTVLRHAAANAHKARKRHADRVVPFSGLSDTDMGHLSYCDDLDFEKSIYIVQGHEVEISNERLAAAMESLTPIQREILLLSCCFNFKDAEIAELLDIPRSTVQYRRKAAIDYARKILEVDL